MDYYQCPLKTAFTLIEVIDYGPRITWEFCNLLKHEVVGWDNKVIHLLMITMSRGYQFEEAYHSSRIFFF